jgi:ankyrin repeat protein
MASSSEAPQLESKIKLASEGQFFVPNKAQKDGHYWQQLTTRGFEKTSGRAKLTLDMVAQRMEDLMKGGESFQSPQNVAALAHELVEHRVELEALREKVLKHVERAGGGLFARARVNRMFKKALGQIDKTQEAAERRAWEILRNPTSRRQDLENACSCFTKDSVNKKDKDGNTPLHLLMKRDDCPKAVERLLSLGADPLAQNKEGMTPLHLAVANDKIEAGRLLAGKIGETGKAEDFPFSNRAGETPFHILAMKDTKGSEPSSWLEILQPIVEAQHLQPFVMKNKKGQTPIHLAMHRPVHGNPYEASNETQEQYGLTHDVNMGLMDLMFPALNESPEPNDEALRRAFKKEGSPLHYALDLLANEENPVARERIFRGMYFISMAHPDLAASKDSRGETAIQHAQRLIKKGAQLPPEALYCCDPSKTKERQGLKEEARKTIQKRRERTGSALNRKEPAALKEAEGVLQEQIKTLKQQQGDTWEERVLQLDRLTPGQNPVHDAIGRCDVEFFKRLCNPINTYHIIQNWQHPNLVAADGAPILFFVLGKMGAASEEEDKVKLLEIFNLLLKESPDLINQKDRSGNTIRDFISKSKDRSIKPCLSLINEAGSTKVRAEMEKTKIHILEQDLGRVTAALGELR